MSQIHLRRLGNPGDQMSLNLTQSQKIALEKAIVNYYNKYREHALQVDDVSRECEAIEKMNPGRELYYQEADRFISELVMGYIYQRKPVVTTLS